jgi:hypothetical protein
VKHLNELQKEFGSKGLVVMAASSEATGTIQPWLEAQGAEYPVFVDDGGATARAYGVKGIPDAVLIGPDGKVAFKGGPGGINAQMLEPVLEKCIMRFNYEFPAGLKRVEAQIAKKDFAGALKSLDKVDEEDAEFAQKVRDDVVGYAADVRKMAESAAAAGDYLSAMESLTELARQFKGTDAGKEVDDLLKEWKKDPAVKKELAAGKLMGQARSLEKGNNFKAALGIYLGIAKKYEGTKTAEGAQKCADKIQEGNLWKSDPRCKKCTAARAPCDKHS